MKLKESWWSLPLLVFFTMCRWYVLWPEGVIHQLAVIYGICSTVHVYLTCRSLHGIFHTCAASTLGLFHEWFHASCAGLHVLRHFHFGPLMSYGGQLLSTMSRNLLEYFHFTFYMYSTTFQGKYLNASIFMIKSSFIVKMYKSQLYLKGLYNLFSIQV